MAAPPLTREIDTIVQDPIVDTIVDVDAVSDDIALKRSERTLRLAISDNYIV